MGKNHKAQAHIRQTRGRTEEVGGRHNRESM